MIIFPKENDILLWIAYIFGPEDSPYKDGIFKVRARTTLTDRSE